MIGSLVVGYLLPGDAAGTRAIRVAGWFLQTLGVCTVASSIATRRQVFSQPSLITRIGRTLRGPQSTTVALTGVAGVGFVGDLAALVIRARKDASIEERLSAIERDLEEIRNEIKSATNSITKLVETARKEIRDEAESRTASFNNIKKQIEDLQAGGIYIDTVGMFLLLLGVLFTSLSDEIAFVFHFARQLVQST